MQRKFDLGSGAEEIILQAKYDDKGKYHKAKFYTAKHVLQYGKEEMERKVEIERDKVLQLESGSDATKEKLCRIFYLKKSIGRNWSYQGRDAM